MSILTSLRRVAAGLLLAAPLALSLPGVRAVADPLPAELPAEQVMCPVPDPEAEDRTAAAMTRLQERLAEDGAAQAGSIVVLNGRGYNYGAAPSARAQLEAVRREAAAAVANTRTQP